MFGKKVSLALSNLNMSLRNHINLVYNYLGDFILYYRDSTVFKIDNYQKIEAQIILDYHSIEKGLLFVNPKPRFGKAKIINLHKYLNDKRITNFRGNTQVEVAYKVMCEYFELHKKNNIDISDYFTEAQYENYKDVLNIKYSPEFEGALHFSKSEFYNANQSNFFDFSYSRKSIRNFTGERIESDVIASVVQLALNSPSVCNRQASKVYLVEDKAKIDGLLKIQGGFSGYTENVVQLLIVTTDRSYFYSIGERNQFFIDGGIFLMNLLYSLHYYKVANCPANWGKTIEQEKPVSKYIAIPKSEKIICMVPIGVAQDDFKVCLSKRRDLNEVFIIA